MKQESRLEILEQAVYAALETYSNVHRGSGYNSTVTTRIYEEARGTVLDHLGLDRKRHTVIFGSPRRAAVLAAQLEPGSFSVLSSRDTGLPLGVRAIAVKKGSLPRGVPIETGGGTTKLIARDWVIWADAPDRFEAGTPPVINVIAFAKALQLMRDRGDAGLAEPATPASTAEDILYHDELESWSGHEMLEKLRQSVIGLGKMVPAGAWELPFINLDNSASTRTFLPVWSAVKQAWRQPEQVQKEIVAEVKQICADAMGAPLSSYEVIFSSNTTESINLAAESLGHEPGDGTEPVVLTTLLEHSSNDLPWRQVPGHSVIRLSIDDEGFIDTGELEATLRAYNQEGLHGNRRIRLVAVSGASNVLGTCNDLPAIGRTVHRYGARFFVDAAQLAAHRRIETEAWGIDCLTFSAHKVYAPFGCGVLLARKGMLHFSPEEKEAIRASGEENVAGIAALGKALVLLRRAGMEEVMKEEAILTARLLRGLSTIPGIRIFGITDPDSPRFASKAGVVSFGVKNRMPSKVGKQLAKRGAIGVRYGCHCAHILIKRLLGISPFLEQFQKLIQILFPKFRFLGMVRVSLGIENTAADADTLIGVLRDLQEKK